MAPAPRHTPNDVIAAVPFTGRTRSVMLGLKYRNRRAVGRHLAGVVAKRLVAVNAHVGVDVVTWTPTSARRRRERGFDQAEVIARGVARALGVPCRRLLERDASPTQTGRSRAQRLDAPSFVARPGLDGRTVLVIDDVVTTGATLASAAEALADRGAAVRLAAVAATPSPAAATVLPFRRRQAIRAA